MKKRLTLIILFTLTFVLVVGCGSKDVTETGDFSPISRDISASRGNDTPPPQSTDSENQETPSAGEGAVDVDLTVLSSTMIYAEVYNIMTNPNNYVGKTIKMSGPYYASYYDETGLYYHYVVVEDAAACCMQGFEFIWSGDRAYPDDYPKDKAMIEVIGVFGSYEELSSTYYYLAVDDIAVLG